MDHREAHVFRFSPDDVEKKRLFANNPFAKVHHKAGEIGAGHVHLDHRYFDEIADGLQGVEEWLLTGPGNARTELANYLEQHRSDLKGKLLANEAADHPTDGELLDRARRTFKRLDRMRPNSPPAGRS
jgi:stalled ribosome rescue protein Dom34